MAERRVGRPTGFKMSKESKEAISKSKLGYKHPEETKKKISDGVKKKHQVGCPIDVLMGVDLNTCGTHLTSRGYINVCIPSPMRGQKTYEQRLHVAVVEQALGRKLVNDEEIHHRGAKTNNDIKTLCLCKNRTEHKLLERVKYRMATLLTRRENYSRRQTNEGIGRTKLGRGR